MAVQGYKVEGVGQLPRAYVIVKSGYMLSAEDLIQYTNSRVSSNERLLGGVVFVESLHKDTKGRLYKCLDKYDSSAQGLDEQFLSSQPKVEEIN